MLTDIAIQRACLKKGGDPDVEKAARLFGDRHPMTLYFLNNQACFLLESGKLDEAEQKVVKLRKGPDRFPVEMDFEEET